MNIKEIAQKHLFQSGKVVMKDINSGLELTGAFFRPTISTTINQSGRKSSFDPGSYYGVTSKKTPAGQRMDVVINRETMSRVRRGEKVVLQSHLTSEVRLKSVIGDVLKDVASNPEPTSN